MLTSAAHLWATNWRYKWSRVRHGCSPKQTGVRADLYPANIREVIIAARALYNNFVYVNDGLFRLYDSIDTAAGAWDRAFNPGPLQDDCDGFHAALLWAVNVKMNSYLITIVSTDIVKSHTALYIPAGPHIVDYNRVITGQALGKMIGRVAEAHNIPGIILVELSKWNGLQWESHKTLSGGDW